MSRYDLPKGKTQRFTSLEIHRWWDSLPNEKKELLKGKLIGFDINEKYNDLLESNKKAIARIYRERFEMGRK